MSVLATSGIAENDDELGFGKAIIRRYTEQGDNLDEADIEASDSEEIEVPKGANTLAELKDLKAANPELFKDMDELEDIDEYDSDVDNKRINQMEMDMEVGAQ